MKTQKNNVATKTFKVSKKLFTDIILIAEEEKLKALEEQDKSRYMYFSGIVSGLKMCLSFKE